MAVPLRPQIRDLEIIPAGPKADLQFALRDPTGFGRTLIMPYGAIVLASLMDGKNTLSEIQTAFKSHVGVPAALSNLEEIVRHLDDAYLLTGDRFDRYRRRVVEEYLGDPVRPASHAGAAYAEEPEKLREELAEFFACDDGPGAIDPHAKADGRQLCGVVSPHIDLYRGGAVFAWAYREVVEHSDADLFVIFGTAHNPMQELFSVSRKDFDTPLGVVATDRQFVDRLAEHLGSSVAGQKVDPFADELTHRMEHSIELQAIFLQYLLGGKRPFRIVPILVGSFQEFIAGGSSPEGTPEVQAFVAAVRAAADGHEHKVCFVSGADLAHIGQRFGDDWLVDEGRLAEQSADDRTLLEAACRCDAAELFAHVAGQHDRRRICGLAPTYTMLEVLGSAEGSLLKYDQAVEPDGTSCVSFASVAYYRS